MSNKTYVLQKDTPNAKAGDEFYYTPNEYRGEGYINKAGMFWHKLIVENNPEWFKLKKEEQPKEKDTFVWSDELVKEFVISFKKIDKLITGVDPIGKTIIEWKQSKSTPKEDKTYTEKELLEAEQKAFEAAIHNIQTYKDAKGEWHLRYPKFSDYKNRVLNNDGKENFKNYL